MLKQFAKLILLLVLTCVAFGQVEGSTRPRVIIGPRCAVAGDTLTLAGVAQIEGDDARLVERLGRITFGYAPTVGNSRALTREAVRSAIEAAGLDAAQIELTMPAAVTIERAVQTIGADQIARAVEEYVRERYSWPAADVNLNVSHLTGDVIVPQGALVIRPTLPSFTVPADRFFVSVALDVDGKVAKYLSVELNVEATATVAVVARPVERGQALGADNVRFERRRVGADLRRYVTNEQALVGKAAAVNLTEGTVLLNSLLNDRMLIKRGDAVKVIARAGKLEVVTLGESKGGGRLGDRVEVLNRNSGRVVVGEIVGDKLVRVTF